MPNELENLNKMPNELKNLDKMPNELKNLNKMPKLDPFKFNKNQMKYIKD